MSRVFEEDEETGLCIKGVPTGLSSTDLQMQFGRFGPVSRIEMKGPTAFLNFQHKSACDEALKHKHVISNQVLDVSRILKKTQSNNGPHVNPLKRKFDNSQKTSPQKTRQGPEAGGGVKVRIDHSAIMTALAYPAPISEQIVKLINLILAPHDYCSYVIENVCTDLQGALKSALRVHELLVFGSMLTGLAFKDSDVDVYACVDSYNDRPNLISPQSQSSAKKCFMRAKGCLFAAGGLFSDIVPIAKAKTPIIKFVHRRTEMHCDLNFKDPIGFCNSRLLRHYLWMNNRFFELIIFLKYWARTHDLCSVSKLSNFSLSMLGISFLLSLKDEHGHKLVPTVEELLKGANPSQPHYVVHGWRCAFNETPIPLSLPDTPEFSLLGLLDNFFSYISNFPFQTHVPSLLTGELISRKAFEKKSGNLPTVYKPYLNHIAAHPENVLCKPTNCAVIHDPFKLNHNLLARINDKVLQEFTVACKASKEICTAAMNSSEKRCKLLHSLLSVGFTAPSLGRGMKAPKKEVQTFEIVTAEPQIPKNSSLKNVVDLIVFIFEKLLLFKISTPDNVECVQAKVQKTEHMEDALQNRPCDMICCEIAANVWEGRKKARKALGLVGVDALKPVETERCVSEFLAKQEYAKVNIKFKCRISSVDGKLNLKFFDANSEKSGDISSCLTCLRQQMPQFLSKAPLMALTSNQGACSVEQNVDSQSSS